MCHKDQPLATIGTMSWPESTAMLRFSIPVSSEVRSIGTLSWRELQVWEASSGRNCKAAVSTGTSDRALFSWAFKLKLASGASLLGGCGQKQVQCGRNHPMAV